MVNRRDQKIGLSVLHLALLRAQWPFSLLSVLIPHYLVAALSVLISHYFVADLSSILCDSESKNVHIIKI